MVSRDCGAFVVADLIPSLCLGPSDGRLKAVRTDC